MGGASIEVVGLGKRYRRGSDSSYGTLREALSGLGRRGEREPVEEFWALRDVDLEVRQGEALGLIGANGAGKTTLLRVLARITQPTAGVARTRGRVGALLEIGTGFHPELSGHDNVFLSGAVMGMSRRDIKRRYTQIVEFSGVSDALELPLKRFSSGMRLRLAFAVAAHLEPELLFVDEILAVGDIDFQRRCLNRMQALQDEGRTVVFVSHDLGAVSRLCHRAAWLDGGRLRRDGDAGEVIADYLRSTVSAATSVDLAVTGSAGVSSVTLLGADGQPVSHPQRGEALVVELGLRVAEAVPGLDVAVALMAKDGTRLVDEAWSDHPELGELARAPGDWTVRLELPPILRAAEYALAIWLGTETVTLQHRDVLAFELAPHPGDRTEWTTRPRLVQPPVTWSVARASDGRAP